jgi:hypothetical protein
VQLGSPFSNVNADSLEEISGGFGYLLTQNNFSPNRLSLYGYSGSFTSFFWTLQQQINPPTGAFGGFAPAADRFYVGVLGSSGGTVQTYSNNDLAGGSGPWHTWSNLQLTTPGASTTFGTAIATSGDYVLVADPGATGGPTVYQYQILHQSMGSPNTATDTIAPIGSSPVFGTVMDVDARCGVVASPSTNTVELFAVNNPLPNLCCDGTGACPATMSACSASNAVTVSIPAVGGGSRATLTVDPNCTDYQTALINWSSQTCATVTFSGELLGPATVCFPDVNGVEQFISRCDPITTLCSGQGATVQHNSQGMAFCCTPLGGTVVGTEFCAQTSSFSSFAFSASWKDTDADQIPDIADNCPFVSNSFQQDQDKDLIGDVCDNCPAVPNQDQKRTTSASVGDACNCALPGVKVGPNGSPCATTPVPAVPWKADLALGALILAVGVFTAGGGRRLFRRTV